jgi:Methylamine utilisation protein MauE
MHPVIELTLALSLAALFAAATLHQLRALAEWPGVVRNYRLVPDGAAGVVAGALLAAEALTAAALAWVPARRLGAASAAVLLLLFGAALWINLRRGRSHIDCGCFGSRLRQRISAWMVARNLALALCALTLLLPRAGGMLSPLELAASLTCVGTLAFLYPVLAVVLRPAPPTYDDNHLATARNRALR